MNNWSGWHGHAKKGKLTRTYSAWASMLQRCNNPNHTGYKNYGGRGISVCTEWSMFTNFLADMGECPPHMEIDRIDNNLGYNKENCRWIAPRENRLNRPHVKLNLEKARIIRDLYSTGYYTLGKLGKIFTVSYAQIHSVVHHRQWPES
jgi:hypothetical protein